jgi:hypothetical protein
MRVSRVFGILLLVTGFAIAQNVPAMPENPMNFLLRSLQNEAGINLKGVVQETHHAKNPSKPKKTCLHLHPSTRIYCVKILARASWRANKL